MLSRKILNLFVMFCLMGLVTLTSCSQNNSTTRVIRQNLDADSVSNIAIGNAIGDIEIRAWEQNAVRFVASIRTTGVIGDEAVAELDNVEVKAERTGGTIHIKVDRIEKTQPSHVSVELVIFVPQYRDLEAATGVGDITLYLPEDATFSVAAGAGVGKVACDFDINGIVKDTQLEGVTGTVTRFRISLNSGVGDINIYRQ